MENSKTILVAGSTGFLGTEVCRQLAAQQKTVKALVRKSSDPARVQALSQLGVKRVVADLREPGSVAAALEGVDVVISTASSTLSQQPGDSIESVDRQGQLNLVAAAKDAGVQHFVFVSFPQSAESFPLQDAKREVEKSIRESGMSYTILRPTVFMEVWLGPHLGFDAAGGKATIYGSGKNRISWISLQDVASFAVAAVDQPVAKNRTIDLGGPEALSPLEVVRLFEQRSGRSFELQFVPEEALRAQMQGPADPLQRSFAALMLFYAAGNEIPMEQTAAEFAVKLRPVSAYCEAVLGTVQEPAAV